jgi:hypothetical protein
VSFWQSCVAMAETMRNVRTFVTTALIARFDPTRAVGHNLGYGVGDDMDSSLSNYVRD